MRVEPLVNLMELYAGQGGAGWDSGGAFANVYLLLLSACIPPPLQAITASLSCVRLSACVSCPSSSSSTSAATPAPRGAAGAGPPPRHRGRDLPVPEQQQRLQRQRRVMTTACMSCTMSGSSR